jgi:hypothetical protein
MESRKDCFLYLNGPDNPTAEAELRYSKFFFYCEIFYYGAKFSSECSESEKIRIYLGTYLLLVAMSSSL